MIHSRRGIATAKRTKKKAAPGPLDLLGSLFGHVIVG